MQFIPVQLVYLPKFRIVDMHSHLAVESSPLLQGASDGNSINGLVLPWLRALDSMNTHDEGFALAVAGGITTSLILPGSADAMGILCNSVSVSI
jgi:imidazolonepropionase-like amidohydrolase